ncbi:hypothetical protein D3C81_1307640 [compost metagenome]
MHGGSVDLLGRRIDAFALHGHQFLQQILVDLGGRGERGVEDVRRAFHVAIGLGLDGAIARGAVHLALFEDLGEQGFFLVARNQRLDLLEQFGRLLHGRGRVFLEIRSQRRVAALDDGGRAADRGKVQAIPVGNQAFLGQRFGHHGARGRRHFIEAPHAYGSDQNGHCQDQDKADAQALADLDICDKAHGVFSLNKCIEDIFNSIWNFFILQIIHC